MAEEFDLSADFFQSVLAHCVTYPNDDSEGAGAAAAPSNDIQLLSHSVEPAVDKGENFGSAVYRARLHYRVASGEPETICLILKVNSSDEAVNAILQELQTFDRELTTYKEVLVECDRALRDVGDSLDFSPK